MKKLISVIIAALMVFTVSVPAFAAEKLSYVVLGDSIGWGAGVLNPQEACPGRIVADTAGYDYKNDAVNGYQAKDLLIHLYKDDVAADVAGADIISISIGGNNFIQEKLFSLAIRAILFDDYSLFDQIIDEFYTDFEKVIGRINELNPDCVILVQTLYNPNYTCLRDIFGYGADKLNAAYARYLDEHPGAFVTVDVAKRLEGNRDYIAVDSIHPSAAGNIEIAAVTLETLYSLGLTDKTEPFVLNEGMDQLPTFKNPVTYVKNLILVLIMNWKVQYVDKYIDRLTFRRQS